MKKRSGATFENFVLLLLGFFFTCTSGGSARLEIAKYRAEAEVADFGIHFEPGDAHSANLMLPPDDPLLCEFPESLNDHVNKSSVDIIGPVALLVSHGKCSPLEKMRIAVEIQQRISKVLKYLIFYNNDPNKPSDIVSLSPPSKRPTDNFETLGMVSVSTTSGNDIQRTIDFVAEITGDNPHMLQPGNRQWRMQTDFYRVDPNGENTSYDVRSNPTSFYWFRLILFALLVASPCCRTAYMWWAGGGRIRIRYNEAGRFVGFLYVPPMSDWFVSTGVHVNGSPITDRLTEEQVLALPEIEYEKPLGVGHDDGMTRNDVELNANQSEITTAPPLPSEAGNNDIVENTDAQQGLEAAGIDVEQPPQLETPPTTHETSCTTCSICIDDFVPGERIRVLPRCKHAFHTECIMPWLTERQGCCPLCKTGVLGDEGSTDADPLESNETHEGFDSPEPITPAAQSSNELVTDNLAVSNQDSVPVADGPVDAEEDSPDEGAAEYPSPSTSEPMETDASHSGGQVAREVEDS